MTAHAPGGVTGPATPPDRRRRPPAWPRAGAPHAAPAPDGTMGTDTTGACANAGTGATDPDTIPAIKEKQ